MPPPTTIELDGEYRLLREEAGQLDRSDRGKFVVRGGEAAEFLQGQLTNDIEGIEVGGGAYAALLDRKGKMQADMRVLRLSDSEILIDLEPETLDATVRHLTMYSVGRDVSVSPLTGTRQLVTIAGPAAASLSELPPLGREHDHACAEIDGIPARAVRTQEGLDLIASPEHGEGLGRALEKRGVAPVTEDALEILRVESGRPRYGREMTQETIPQEAGINERAVSFTKGCYIGQETVARLHYKGKPNRHLRGLRLARPAEAGVAVTLGERELGKVGTAVLSPGYGAIALAVLRREAEPGDEVLIGGEISAEVVELPFERVT
jgi:folate-binding protein YgfZ